MAQTIMSPGSHWPRTSTLRGCRTNRLLRMFLLFAQTLIGLSVLSVPLQALAFGSLGTNSAVSSSCLRLLKPRASSIREMNMTRSTASREGQPVVAVNPTNPDNIVFVSTRFHPLSSDGGETWAAFNQIPGPVNVCLNYQIPDLPPICAFPGRSIAVHNGILASAAEGSNGHPEM
ncbi:hypothetical protein CCUS01_02534 [Colletotrichum cuscutae]|uniref:Uncharacterized protein n=1 Tax=Colletotrichum cuscutae TaxID=1209917 RepID=A0AAJ0DQ69_9PEZI|nr:hypothetical protein CCUS01_02534 [Colletotrichum cuscutae]